MIRVDIIADDEVRARGFLAEHGLAYWLRVDGRQILFDTGQGLVLKHNAALLQHSLSDVDFILLSHGHYDHIGGLLQVHEAAPNAVLYAHPAALQPKYKKIPDGSTQSIGIESTLPDHIQFTSVTKPTSITQHLHMTGPVPRYTEFEQIPAVFCDVSGSKPDTIPDDQACYLETPQGIVVLLGCAHHGLINTLNHIAALTGTTHFHGIAGGTHLIAADAHQLEQTILALSSFQFDWLAPGHCTGTHARNALWAAFPQQCMPFYAGQTFRF